MPDNILFGVVGGLGLFLFGMKVMSEGLQKIAGRSLRKILEMLTKTTIGGGGSWRWSNRNNPKQLGHYRDADRFCAGGFAHAQAIHRRDTRG
ncbi:MAG: hypothetical protein ABIA67_06745 [Candidatus Margulisiibacteriota bacterium]